MRIAITGATGLLGRNLLFEILKHNLSALPNLEIIILGRSNTSEALIERLKGILLDDGVYYLGLDQANAADILNNIAKSFIPICFDLSKDKLGISSSDYQTMLDRPIDFFFHCAALTDFRFGKTIEDKLNEINVNGTRRICELIEGLSVNEAIYIGSAYSCGDKVGLVPPGYMNLHSQFRNPYEKSKLDAEIVFRDLSRSKKIRYRVFRPSTICGRLIEKPLGKTSKYDVFYSWIAFFLREKIKMLSGVDGVYEKHIEMPVRLHFNPKGGLNIVPADYGAKAIYWTCLSGDEGTDYHIANSSETTNRLYGDLSFSALNISGQEYTIDEPGQKNPIERLYYRTVGRLFTPYGLSDPIIFDVNNINRAVQSRGIICPKVDEKGFGVLLDFAKMEYFGVDIDKALRHQSG